MKKSYCRWSSDSFRSDVRCEHTDRGFETHVAVLRRVLDDDVWAPSKSLLGSDAHRYDEELLVFTAALDRAPRVSIGLAHDGEVFVDDTEAAMYERLAVLAEAGYRVPADILGASRSNAALTSA